MHIKKPIAALITESGTRYFVCGRMGHCQQGLKLKVKVQAQSNNTGTSPPPISPPCPHSPPSPPDDNGSTKCRSEAAGPSVVDLEFHDSLSEDALQQAVFEVKSFDNQISIFSYLGDAEIHETEVSLSNRKLSPSRQCVSSGALFFNSPLIFYDFKQKRPLSFKTSFGFSISTLAKPEYFGHGISFIISPAIAYRDGPFAYPENFFGVSIDTNLDPFGTPTELYIRLFNNSSSALASAKFIEDIRSGEEFTCWVEFEAITDIMKVYLDVGFIKPIQPLLVTRGAALDPYLSSNNGIHFVGLTGSSNGCIEVYQIHSWALKMEQKKVNEEGNLEQ